MRVDRIFQKNQAKGSLPSRQSMGVRGGGRHGRSSSWSCASGLSAASGCLTSVPHQNPFLGFQFVLVHSSCSNKIPSSRCLLKNRTYFSQIRRQGSPRSRRWQIRCLARARFPVQRWHLVAVSSRDGQDEGALRGLLTRGLMLFVRTPLL